jgi:hypothetical protein
MLEEPLNPSVRDELPSLPLRKQSLDPDKDFSDEDDGDVSVSSLTPVGAGFYSKSRDSEEEKVIRVIKDARKIVEGEWCPLEPLTPISNARFGRPRDGATRRSGAPHKGTRKADYLSSLSKASSNSAIRSQSSVSGSSSQRPKSKSCASASQRKSSREKGHLKANSDHGVTRRSHGNLPTIEEFHKCSFREDKSQGPSGRSARKVSSCGDIKQHRKSSSSKQANRMSQRNATFDNKISRDGKSLFPTSTRSDIQNSILDPLLFEVDDEPISYSEGIQVSDTKTAQRRTNSSNKYASPVISKFVRGKNVSFESPAEQKFTSSSSHGRSSSTSIPPLYPIPSLRKQNSASSIANFVDEDEAFPPAPSSTRGVFDGLTESESPRLPTRKKSAVDLE